MNQVLGHVMLGIGVFVLASAIAFGLIGGEGRLRKRVEGLVPPRVGTAPRPRRGPMRAMQRGLTRAGNHLTSALQRQRLLERCEQAGWGTERALHVMLAVKAAGFGLGLVLGWLAPYEDVNLKMLAASCLALLGLLGPEVWLSRRIAERQTAIAHALPDTLDLLTASTEAGLSMDAAIQRLISRQGKRGHELREELARYLGDMRLGIGREEALRGLSRRCGIPEMRGVVSALLQADQLGVGAGMVLGAQSEHLRIRRRQRAQEEAQKAPVKMLFPLVFCLFPAMFAVLLGPAALRLIDQFR